MLFSFTLFPDFPLSCFLSFLGVRQFLFKFRVSLGGFHFPFPVVVDPLTLVATLLLLPRTFLRQLKRTLLSFLGTFTNFFFHSQKKVFFPLAFISRSGLSATPLGFGRRGRVGYLHRHPHSMSFFFSPPLQPPLPPTLQARLSRSFSSLSEVLVYGVSKLNSSLGALVWRCLRFSNRDNPLNSPHLLDLG